MNRRIIVIDDDAAVHADFRRILAPEAPGPDGQAGVEPDVPPTRFALTVVGDGQRGCELVKTAESSGRPFALAFVDIRMGPGRDGMEVVQGIWRDCPDLQIVICTATSEYSYREMARRIGPTDRLLIARKPLDPIEILQMARALTYRWNLERQSTNLLTRLASIARTRTEELESARDDLVAVNDDLRRAKDTAEAANKAKTLLLANVSHELRTPMTAIVGYAEELEEHCAVQGSDFEREASATIRRNAHHLIGLIGDLLDVAKMETGKLTVTRVPCAPSDLFAAVLAILAPRATAKGLRLACTCKTPIPVVIATDPLRFRQILVNVIDNALKFTEQGSVELEVALHSDGEPRLLVAIKDSGIGMAPEFLSRVFRPFEQADASTTRRYGGNGLGLAISRQLAELLGGGIDVVSEPGVGSCFTVAIATGPLEGVLLTADALGKAHRLPEPAPKAPLPSVRARVLLVEDGKDNQRLIGLLLRKAGCTVEFAMNGVECLAQMAAAELPFDLVLMDMQMPVMDGVEATRTLRQRGCAVPIVALTANALPADEEACLAAGCNAFLTKPVDRRRLIEVVAENVRRNADGR